MDKTPRNWIVSDLFSDVTESNTMRQVGGASIGIASSGLRFLAEAMEGHALTFACPAKCFASPTHCRRTCGPSRVRATSTPHNLVSGTIGPRFEMVPIKAALIFRVVHGMGRIRVLDSDFFGRRTLGNGELRPPPSLVESWRPSGIFCILKLVKQSRSHRR